MSKRIVWPVGRYSVLMFAVCLLFSLASGVAVPSLAKADSAGDWLQSAFKSKLGGPVNADAGSRKKRGPKGVQVASLGDSYFPKLSSGPKLSGGVTWVASSGCINSTLRNAISEVASSYGKVTVSSTCRSHGHNARVGGAPKSHVKAGAIVPHRSG